MVTLARHAGTPAIEASEFDWWHEAPHYVKSRVLAERAVLEAQVNHGLPAIVLCVANTYGPEDYGPTPHGNALWQATKHQTTALDCSLPTVDIRDAAHACLLAEQHGRVGERYAIVNELFISEISMPWQVPNSGIHRRKSLHAKSLCLCHARRNHQSNQRR